MNLKHLRLMNEDEKAFHVHDTNSGAKFRVSKKGLGKETLGQIQKHFAKGGEVKKMAEGGEAPEEMDAPPVPPMAYQIANLDAPQPTGLMSGSVLNAPPGSEITDSGQMTAPPAMVQRELQADAGYTPPPEEEAKRQETAKPPPEAPAAAPSGPAIPSIPGLPNQEKAFRDAFGMQQKGGGDLATALEAEGTKKAAALDAYMKAAHDTDALHKQQRLSLDKENQELLNQLKSYQVDPKRIWKEAGTGGRILSAIGIALGGIGAGMTHSGQNAALQVVQSAIDRDVDAQKAELGKKHNLLSLNLQRTHNLDEAYALTKAQLWTTAQGELAKAGALAQGPEAQARAEMLNGQFAEKRESTLNGLYQQKRAAALQNVALAQNALAQNAQQQALARLASGKGTQADALLVGGDKAVTLPNGMYGMAKSKELGEKFSKAAVGLDTLESTVGAAEKLMAEVPHMRGVALSDAKARAEQLSVDLLLQGKEAANLGVLSESDTKLMDALRPDLAGMNLNSNVLAKLKGLRDKIARGRTANIRHHTLIQVPNE